MLLTQGCQTQRGVQGRLLTENQESDKGLHSQQGDPGPLFPTWPPKVSSQAIPLWAGEKRLFPGETEQPEREDRRLLTFGGPSAKKLTCCPTTSRIYENSTYDQLFRGELTDS